MRKSYHNRMARIDTRATAVPINPEPIQADPAPKVHPVVRELVAPPPESVPKCPRCGAARIGQWKALGSPNGRPRKDCRACGVRVEFSEDWRTVRIVG